MDNTIKIYEVGGKVRDFFLNIPNKDADFCVIAPSYKHMKDYLVGRGAKIYLEKPEFFTIRCKLPPFGDADFRLGRTEGHYSDGRRPDQVYVASCIEDDLYFRDFTVNAIAKDEDGNIIDPFGGSLDLQNKLIRCVGNPYDRFDEDALRLLRAVRFSITKGFEIEKETEQCLFNSYLLNKLRISVSVERIREELNKCFKFDTIQTLQVLSYYVSLRNICFKTLKLEATLKK
jgi:tRNA nucleotidyltransferase/poly(A) polymerase